MKKRITYTILTPLGPINNLTADKALELKRLYGYPCYKKIQKKKRKSENE